MILVPKKCGTYQNIGDRVGKESLGIQHISQHLRRFLGLNSRIMCIFEHFNSCSDQSGQSKDIRMTSSGSQNDIVG